MKKLTEMEKAAIELLAFLVIVLLSLVLYIMDPASGITCMVYMVILGIFFKEYVFKEEKDQQ